jgi:ParB-like chromosome segregation protein Spo0J
MKLEKVALKSLVLDPKNVRDHSEASIKAIAESLEAFGQRKPVVITSDNTVVTGNGTVQAAGSLGWSDIEVVRVPSDWSDEKVAAFAIADNRTAEFSSWSTDALLEALGTFELEDLEVVGFTEGDIEDLLDLKRNPFTMERVDITLLKPHKRNYQEHPDDQLEHIIKSIETHGFYRNIVVARDNTILAGHGVVKAALKMGKKRIPVIRLDIDPDEPRALKVITSDNEINNLAVVDDRALTEMLRDVMTNDVVGLSGTGFDAEQLAALTMVTRHKSEIEDKNAAAEWLGMPEFEQADKVLKVVVNFESADDREAFAQAIGQKFTDKTNSVWFPFKEKRDIQSLKFDYEDE